MKEDKIVLYLFLTTIASIVRTFGMTITLIFAVIQYYNGQINNGIYWLIATWIIVYIDTEQQKNAEEYLEGSKKSN